MPCLRSTVLAAALCASLTSSVLAQELPHLHVVLFTPSDVDPPKGVQERLTQVADYTEKFLVTWMTHWEYKPQRERIFDRNPDGSLRVLFIKGKDTLASGKYAKAGFEMEVRQTANAQYKTGPRHVWWIWVYLGNAKARFVGGGNSRTGGNAFVNYDATPEKIPLNDALASPALEKLLVKGCMHELGHALGLPHDGPLDELDLGMPLMGATIINYRRRTKTQETRGHLSQASAAILWKHPLFSGTAVGRGKIPNFQLSPLTAVAERKGRGVKVSGKITSDIAAHSVVIYDSVPDDQEAYWQKPYVGRVDGQGRFDVAITEPSLKAGTLRLLVCFENGIVTGNGKELSIGSALEKPYRVVGKTYRLEP